eukprot:1162131-Pelagomonas_calceolata.AAC.14
MAALAQHLYSWLVAKDGTVTTQSAGQPPTATALYPTSALSFNSGGYRGAAGRWQRGQGAARLSGSATCRRACNLYSLQLLNHP